MRKFYPVLLLSCFLFSSCAVLDMPARFAGFSTQKFKNEKTGRFDSEFELSKRAAFDKTLEILEELRARVTHKSFRKGYITAFDFSKSFDYCLDSTEIGFFIEELEENRIRIEVVCNNSILARNVSVRFFELMEAK